MSSKNRLLQLIKESTEFYIEVYQNDGKMIGYFNAILHYLKSNGVKTAKIQPAESISTFHMKGIGMGRERKSIQVKEGESSYAQSLVQGLIEICKREKLIRPVFFKGDLTSQ